MLRTIGEQERDRQVRHFAARRADLGFRLQVIHLTDTAIKPDRIERRDRGQQCGFALTDQFTDGHLLGADQTAEGRPDIAIPQIQLRRLHIRLGRQHAGLAAIHRRQRVIQILLRDGPLLGERRKPGDVFFVFVQRRLGLGQHALRRREPFLERFVIQLEQWIPFFDFRAFREQHLVHERFNTGAHLDILR